MTRLLNDVCRCHDDACPERENCLRWLQRDTGTENTPHAATLYYTLPGEVPVDWMIRNGRAVLNLPCPARILPEEP